MLVILRDHLGYLLNFPFAQKDINCSISAINLYYVGNFPSLKKLEEGQRVKVT